MTDIIITIIENIIIIAAFLTGRYLVPKIKLPDCSFTQFLSEWAYKFVVEAKNTSALCGTEKKCLVTDKIEKLSLKYGINLSDDQISALIEDAYSAMKAGESIADKN